MSDADRPDPTRGPDLDVVGRLFEEQLGPITRYVYSYVKSWEVAEDIVHDVFLHLWLRYRRLQPVRDPVAYLYSAARYDALDFIRHRGVEMRHQNMPDPDVLPVAQADQDTLSSEVEAALHRVVDSLPSRQRQIILLRWKHQASYDEIAAELKISRKTVDAHIQRAYAKLRDFLPRWLS